MTTVDARPSAEVVERNVELGYWSRRGLPDHVLSLAEQHPDKELVLDRSGRRTYGEIAELTRRCAHALRELGIRPKEVVLVQTPNWWEAVVANLALEAIGAVAVPLPPMFRRKEVQYIAELTKAVAAVYAPSYGTFDFVSMYRDVAESLPRLRLRVVVAAEPMDGARTFASLVAEPAPGEPVKAFGSDPDAVMEIGFTSGSTGNPKGAVHTSNTLSFEHLTWGRANGLGPDDVFFIPSTIGHQLGYSVMRAALLFGGRMVLLDRWDAEGGTDLMARERATFMITTPAFLFDVLRSKRLAELGGVPSMKVWVLAGQVVTSELHKEAVSKFPQVRFARQFGMTEIGSMIINNMAGPEDKALATGLVQPGAEMRVLDDELRDVPKGETGELVLRAPSLFLGYFGHEETTKACFTPDGFFRTGDEVRVDAEDWVWVTGRLKDLIKRGGESVSPAEIEEILAAHPKLVESSVVGSPDPRLGERVCVFAVPKSGETISLEEIVTFVASTGIAKQKLPERLIVIEDLPRTSIGKVHKAVLKKMAASSAE